MSNEDPPIPPALVLEREPTWAAELDEAIFAGQAADAYPAKARAWAPKTLEEAEWCMTRLRALQDRARQIAVQGQAWAQRVTEWRAAEEKRIAPGLEYFEGRLERYALEARAADPKHKTVYLPSGDIGTQQPKAPKVEVVDEDALIEWLQEEIPGEAYDEIVETKERVKLVEFRKAVSVQQTLLPWCQQCGVQLTETGGHRDDVCPTDPDGIHSVGCGCPRYDHDPDPGPGYEVLLDSKPVPGVQVTVVAASAKVKPAR